MSARDELAEVIANFRDDWYKVQRKSPAGIDRAEAKAILAAGYSKPRTITTAEELDALTDGSLIETKGGIVFQKYDGWHAEGDNGWQRPGYSWCERTRHFADSAHLPISILHEPKSA
jgi:hypothetical protein